MKHYAILLFVLLTVSFPICSRAEEIVFRHNEEIVTENRVVLSLPLEKIRGTKIQVCARIKAENVAKPPNPWNGVKCMVHSKNSLGDKWEQQNELYGTFEWKTVRFIATVSRDTTLTELVLGIENTTGKAWFKDIEIRTIAKERTRPTRPKQRTVTPQFMAPDVPRLRGVMIQPATFEEKDLNVLVDWGVNHVRWQLLWGGFPNGPADSATIPQYLDWIEKQCEKLDRILPLCEEKGVYVVIDLHTPPGGRLKDSTMRMFQEKEFQDAFLTTWEKIARRYHTKNANGPEKKPGIKAVCGFDLVNEPVEGVIPREHDNAPVDWRTLADRATKMIREIDPERTIILEAAPWGGPDALDWFEPLDAENIVYSAHMYIPHSFTHQGVYNQSSGITYPGETDGKHWNKEQLKLALKPVTEYQLDYGVPIYLGEFSVIRWAPGDSGVKYLRDCVEIFEEQHWDWAYHAFREWSGWSLEHGPERNDNQPSKTPTDRLRLMKKYFEKNRTF